MKRKLELAKALKSLHALIVLSKQKTEEFRDQQHTEDDWRGDEQGRAAGVRDESYLESFGPGTTVVPWWARTNSHGRRRRRRKAPVYSLLSIFN